MIVDKRNYGLDVARCLAILMVVITHGIQNSFGLSVPFLWYCGYGGVELFFSLSGFLIGWILMDLFENTRLTFKSIGGFWVRRWFRTLPLFYILYFVYLIIYNRFMYPVSFNWKYLLFIHNFAEVPPLFMGESWSLSVEEWSYLLIPVIIAAVITTGKTRFMTGICIVIVAEIIGRFLYQNHSLNIYKLVLFRMDAVLYGMAGAWLIRNRKVYLKASTLIVVGLAVWLLAAIIKMKCDHTGIPGRLYFPIVGVGTAMFVMGLYLSKFNKRYTVVTYISKISYSMYLVHLSGIIIPLFYFTHWGSVTSLVVLLPLIFVLSSVTYYFIEKPFLQIRDKWFPR